MLDCLCFKIKCISVSCETYSAITHINDERPSEDKLTHKTQSHTFAQKKKRVLFSLPPPVVTRPFLGRLQKFLHQFDFFRGTESILNQKNFSKKNYFFRNFFWKKNFFQNFFCQNYFKTPIMLVYPPEPFPALFSYLSVNNNTFPYFPTVLLKLTLTYTFNESSVAEWRLLRILAFSPRGLHALAMGSGIRIHDIDTGTVGK